MAIILGLDSGGTKTLSVLVDREGTVVSRHLAAGLDPTAGDDWQGRLAQIVTEIGQVPDAAVLGLSCHGEIPAISREQQDTARRLIGPQAKVINDVHAAFEGALAGQDGILLLAGTGSMVWGRGTKGHMRAGGWSDAFGDEGSAFWIGREALSIVSRHLDGRQFAPGFATALLAHLNLTADTLLGWTYGQTQQRATFASLAREVSILADAGDATALALMERAAGELALLGLAALRTAGLADTPRWSYAGSVFRDRTLRETTIRLMGCQPIPPRLPPVGGAVLEAARMAGWPVTEAWIDRLAAQLS